MKVHTTNFADIPYKEEDLFIFSEGLFGFSGCKRFLLESKEDSLFYFLHSVDDAKVSFVLMEPKIAVPDYVTDIYTEDLQDLGVNLQEYLILTLAKNPEDVTVNLLGPVFINVVEKLGKQVISCSQGYTTRHKLFSLVGDNVEKQKVG